MCFENLNFESKQGNKARGGFELLRGTFDFSSENKVDVSTPTRFQTI